MGHKRTDAHTFCAAGQNVHQICVQSRRNDSFYATSVIYNVFYRSVMRRAEALFSIPPGIFQCRTHKPLMILRLTLPMGKTRHWHCMWTLGMMCSLFLGPPRASGETTVPNRLQGACGVLFVPEARQSIGTIHGSVSEKTFKNVLFIFERAQAGEWQRERGTEDLKRAPCWQQRARYGAWTHELQDPWLKPKSDAQPTEPPPGAPFLKCLNKIRVCNTALDENIIWFYVWRAYSKNSLWMSENIRNTKVRAKISEYLQFD